MWNADISNLSACSTDNASNICLAMSILGWPHFPCFSHTLQLGVKKAMEIPQVTKAIGRVKRVANSGHILRKTQNALKYNQLSTCIIYYLIADSVGYFHKVEFIVFQGFLTNNSHSVLLLLK